MGRLLKNYQLFHGNFQLPMVLFNKLQGCVVIVFPGKKKDRYSN